MKRFLMMASIILVTTVFVQAGDPYDLAWNSIDGGGEMFSTGGTYSLGGTIGQTDAGPESGSLMGGDYALIGGFWPAAAPACFCPGDINQDGDRNGADVQYFVSCLTEGAGCNCADVNQSDGATIEDLSTFVDLLIAGESCK